MLTLKEENADEEQAICLVLKCLLLDCLLGARKKKTQWRAQVMLWMIKMNLNVEDRETSCALL